MARPFPIDAVPDAVVPTRLPWTTRESTSEAFDDPLLVRQGRGYVLSEHAEALVEPLRQVLEELHALRQPAVFDPARCERRFCLAASDYVAEHMLPLLVAALEREAPGVSLEYRTWQAGQYALLASGEIDLATTLFDESPPNLHGRLLGEDRAVCLMRNDHPLAAHGAISQRVASPAIHDA